ncbi:MAG TPA: asparagine synthase (glutamine-hydrolyzing) [Bryobacteraceae bacterium]|jgi:asparagine synthase (glutamine-hydrolysing)
MCGIAGLIGCGDPSRAETAVRAMVHAIRHRGPDSEGLDHWPNAYLGHRRLAIIDLSPAGHQPMLSDDGKIGLVFNGCIYNFLELRADLEKRGHHFRSHCDTEVLLRGYQEWGIDGLVPRLRGMFAFGIWDDPAQTLSLVRDRLGVKPLIYSSRDGQIAFASTVGALRAGGFAGEIDPQAVLEFLEFGSVTDDRSIFEGVQKLAAGTILVWKRGAVTTRPYWTLPEPDENSRITFEEAVEETERLLLESVRLRLFADVPIGALLSAGIDSTLVCWAMAKLNANVTAFTVSTPGDPEDEAPFACETAKLLGIPHQVVSLPHDQQDLLQELGAAYDEPFGCPSAMAMLRVSRAVKPHATVLLTGDGGDDVFLGYDFHRHYFRAQQIARKLPPGSAAAWNLARPVFDAVPRLRRPKHFLDYITGGLGAVTRAHSGIPYYRSRGLFGPRLHGGDIQQRNMSLSAAAGRNILQDFLNYQQRMWFVAEFMTKVDGATMHYALEARSPFLDHTLWDFAAKLPFEMRLRGGTLKAILREIVRRRINPAVASRKKQGFAIPVERWLTTRWQPQIQDILHNSSLEREGWLNPGALAALAKQSAAAGDAPMQLWFLLVLENWMTAGKGAPADPTLACR